MVIKVNNINNAKTKLCPYLTVNIPPFLSEGAP